MGRFRDAWNVLRQKRATTSDTSVWSTLMGRSKSATGVAVTTDTALQVSAVYASVRLLSETISSLPIDVVRQSNGRRITVDTSLTRLVTDKPNPEMDAAEMWRTVIGWMLLEGNGYIYIERDGNNNRPKRLWPLPATSVSVGRDPVGELYYDIYLTGTDHKFPTIDGTQRVRKRDILHYRAFGTGLYGLSPIQQIKEAVGTSLASQRYMAKFYANDARPGGFITVPGNLSDDQYERMEASWNAAHKGMDKSHLMAILEGGAQWETVGLNPDDAAFIETQKWEVTEIARAFGVPPHLIGDVERSTSWGSGIAEQGMGFVRYTLTPWITRLEQVTRHGLFDGVDSRLQPKWRVEGLQRGDIQSRYNAYAVGRNWGWLSANDVRQLEDMDPVPAGDTYLQPLNMTPAGTIPESNSGGNSSGNSPQRYAGTRDTDMSTRDAASRQQIAQKFAERIEDVDRKLAELEQEEVNRLAREYLDAQPERFLEELDRMYEETIQDLYVEQYGPVLSALAAEVVSDVAESSDSESDLSDFVDAYVQSHADQHQHAMRRTIRNALEEAENLADVVEQKMQHQVDERPKRKSLWESQQMMNAATREQWRADGVRTVRWEAGRKGCPYCDQLDGREIGITDSFATQGDEFTDSEGKKLAIDRTIQHPPIHPGCDCGMEAA